MSSSAKSDSRFTPFAALLAWIWPGLGHLRLGQRRRGMLIMFGVLFLFLGGVLIGGVDAVDRRNDPLWFMAQALCGPIAFGTDLANQRLLSDRQVRLQRKSLSHINEFGTLFAALAGLMNLVVILDALHRPAPRRTTDRRAQAEP